MGVLSRDHMNPYRNHILQRTHSVESTAYAVMGDTWCFIYWLHSRAVSCKGSSVRREYHGTK